MRDLKGRDVFAGLDLSATTDLTALVLIGHDIATGIWHVQPTFWLPADGLFDKARTDKIPWDLWHSQGHLQTTPGASISYEHIAQHLRKVFGQYHVVKIAFDRWNVQYLVPWLLAAGFSDQLIKENSSASGRATRT